jgi:hypothetical protein
MAASALASAALTAAGKLGGAAMGGKNAGLTSQRINDRSAINVAPVGVNLGEILRPFREGSPANGGYGIQTPSRWIGGESAGFSPKLAPQKATMDEGAVPVLILGGLAIAGLFVFRKLTG